MLNGLFDEWLEELKRKRKKIKNGIIITFKII